MAETFLKLDSGTMRSVESTAGTGGTADANKIFHLDGAGKIPVEVLPAGAGPDIFNAEASEALSAGNYVNLWNDSGTAKVRKADNTNSRPAHGFVRATVANAATASVYPIHAPNPNAPTGTIGARAYLGTAGGVITTPLDEESSSNDGYIHQYLGFYTSTSRLEGADRHYIQIDTA